MDAELEKRIVAAAREALFAHTVYKPVPGGGWLDNWLMIAEELVAANDAHIAKKEADKQQPPANSPKPYFYIAPEDDELIDIVA